MAQTIEYRPVISHGIQYDFAPGQAFKGQFQSFSVKSAWRWPSGCLP